MFDAVLDEEEKEHTEAAVSAGEALADLATPGSRWNHDDL